MASRLLWDKGVREYVDAALSLSKRRRHIEFLLAGTPDEGNPGSVPIGVLDEWRKLGAVKLLGHVDDMPSLLSQVHIMVLPTSYGEGVPRSLVEAAACGLPIIASDSAGCREVVAHGENGLMVPPRDAQALASAIENLIDHPEERRRMGIRGRERVLNEFEESIVLEKTLAVYDELLMSPA
jgi:glycosyltransferase involved in cell wall biosynthesis